MGGSELELDSARNFSLILAPWGGPGKVDADLRASLFAALGAAFLSMLVGILAGVVLGWILLRALIFGAVIGALAFGAARLVRSALPGVLSDRPDEAAEGADSIFSAGEAPAGSRVDIVLPGGDADDIAEEASSVEPVGDEAIAEAEPEGQDAEAISLIDARFAGSPSAAAVPPPPMPRDSGSRLESLEDLDVLPDLDGFTDSFAAAEFSSGGSAAQAPAPRGEERSSPRTQDGLDPASLAKAVRTILKRDQKG